MDKYKRFIKTASAKETQTFARKFAQGLKGGEVLCLYGDLGFGKTTFMQGVADGLGIKGRVVSPTFLIMRQYTGKFLLYHIDLYRIQHPEEIIDLGIMDLMHDPRAIVAVEWPERLGNFIPEKHIDIHFGYNGETNRTITIQTYGTSER